MADLKYRTLIEVFEPEMIGLLKTNVPVTDRDRELLRAVTPIIDVADRNLAGVWRICDNVERSAERIREGMGRAYPGTPFLGGRSLIQEERGWPWKERFEHELWEIVGYLPGGEGFRNLDFGFFVQFGHTYSSIRPTEVFTIRGENLAVELLVDADPARLQKFPVGDNATDILRNGARATIDSQAPLEIQPRTFA